MEPWDKVVLPRAEVREGRVAQGNPAVGLNVDSQGRPGVSLYDRDSKRRLLLGVDSAPYINLLDTSDKAVWRAP